ncbi:hypothetical protein C8R45DRAFT_428874 [Mycena sanguinolenta]|nr:hypothetical protein C8R45DRAFT_428874 [Mycena sanguinolenta]
MVIIAIRCSITTEIVSGTCHLRCGRCIKGGPPGEWISFPSHLPTRRNLLPRTAVRALPSAAGRPDCRPMTSPPFCRRSATNHDAAHSHNVHNSPSQKKSHPAPPSQPTATFCALILPRHWCVRLFHSCGWCPGSTPRRALLCRRRAVRTLVGFRQESGRNEALNREWDPTILISRSMVFVFCGNKIVFPASRCSPRRLSRSTSIRRRRYDMIRYFSLPKAAICWIDCVCLPSEVCCWRICWLVSPSIYPPPTVGSYLSSAAQWIAIVLGPAFLSLLLLPLQTPPSQSA